MLGEENMSIEAEKQEPVAWQATQEKSRIETVPAQGGVLRTMQKGKDFTIIPHKREWVGLTDEEQEEIYKKHSMDGWGLFYDAIEAKLKEKNT